ncbi:MAG: outer membrane lipoprotein-sorting protein [Thermodesulfovibrionales bacterium]
MRFIFIAFLLLTLINVGIAMGAELDANQIVMEADKIRFPKDSFEIMAELVTRKELGEEDVLHMKIYSKGPERVLAEFTHPPREKGKAILLVEDNMWMYLPDLKKTLRVSPTQQLMNSNFSNGDILRIDFAGDYNARLIGMERLNNNEAYYLELIAKKKEATYHRVLYWIQKDSFMPVKAEFYSPSGRLLKTLNFVEFKEMAGRLRPIKMVMSNPFKKGETSTMVLKKIEIIKLPDSRFNPNFLGRQ